MSGLDRSVLNDIYSIHSDTMHKIYTCFDLSFVNKKKDISRKNFIPIQNIPKNLKECQTIKLSAVVNKLSQSKLPAQALFLISYFLEFGQTKVVGSIRINGIFLCYFCNKFKCFNIHCLLSDFFPPPSILAHYRLQYFALTILHNLSS